MKSLIFIVALTAIAPLTTLAQPKLESEVPRESLDSGTFELRPDRAEMLYVGPRSVTSIAFKTKTPIDDIQVGSAIVGFDYDEAYGVLNIRANAVAGKTNLRILAGGRIYTIIVNIVKDGRVVFGRTYTLAGEDLDDSEVAQAASVPKIRPDQIDVAGMTRVIERAMVDPVYARQQQEMKSYPLNKAYVWNHCPVVLRGLSFFPALNALVFRVEFVNSTQMAQYMHRRQYELWVANKEIPIAARYQLINDATILPGQIDTVYLVVQGENINPNNDWRLELPVESSAVRAALGGN